MRKIKLILLGAPGAGKGTQAEIISKKYAIPSISTGNMIREAIAAGTEMGRNAKSFIDSGALVPDEVVIGIIKERLAKPDCENGFILDGFPRTVPQAQALDDMGVEITDVISIEVPDEKIVERMGGRRVCKSCGASYHVKFNPSENGEFCDCGELLTIRSGGAFPHGKPDNFPPSADSGHDTARFPMRGIILSITEFLPLVKSFSAKGRFLPSKGRKILKSCGTAAQKTVPYDKFP